MPSGRVNRGGPGCLGCVEMGRALTKLSGAVLSGIGDPAPGVVRRDMQSEKAVRHTRHMHTELTDHERLGSCRAVVPCS